MLTYGKGRGIEMENGKEKKCMNEQERALHSLLITECHELKDQINQHVIHQAEKRVARKIVTT